MGKAAKMAKMMVARRCQGLFGVGALGFLSTLEEYDEEVEKQEEDEEDGLCEEEGRGVEMDDFTWLKLKGSCLHGLKNENNENKLKISSET